VLPIGRSWGTIGLRAAATVALVVGAGYLWLTRSTGSEGPAIARTYTAPVGRTDSIRLDDGSRVVLGPGSVMAVTAGYGQPARAVELQGEALFDVTHDEQHPFSVRAGVALIEDIGTTFTVRNVGDDPVRVVVTVGSVRLQGQGPQQGSERGPVVLKPGDRGTVGRDGRVLAERSRATPEDLAWTRGQLIFDNAPLGRVRADLRRWYGVDLRIDDPALASRHLTASFTGEPVQRVLDVIGLALGAKIQRHGDTAVVRAR
jgi:transmembrane sensor